LIGGTKQWEPNTYPDPRTNAAKCNTVEHSTLCDPDRILTDTWRQTINDNIAKQTQRLLNVDVQYTEEAKENCTMGNVTDVRIFVILARRINTTSNQNITSKDLTTFGHDLREAFGLDAQPCKNYILILGVELAKELYVWTGSDLVFPKDRMNTSLSQYKNMFLERNYMEGLNKIVEEVGNILVDPFKGPDSSTTNPRIPTIKPASLTLTLSLPGSYLISTPIYPAYPRMRPRETFFGPFSNSCDENIHSQHGASRFSQLRGRMPEPLNFRQSDSLDWCSMVIP
uniref:SCP domain-containing protein n=1 Tax=Heligmosomoides polygyrus TaxID=6339 RepID=A0A183G8T6_HELPZ